ncbi:MAG: hypothetical protein IPO04_22105 [Cytophagaceae bacterium]|nr:hypothetical protein [Cytophagaceae bacterium]
MELTENDFLSVKGIAPGHFDLEKSLDIALPENGGKRIELELKLTLDEYTEPFSYRFGNWENYS